MNGSVAVDKLGRYEHLVRELEKIAIKLGLKEMIDLPDAKAKFRIDKRSYRDILGYEERDRISEIFKEEIALLDYQF